MVNGKRSNTGVKDQSSIFQIKQCYNLILLTVRDKTSCKYCATLRIVFLLDILKYTFQHNPFWKLNVDLQYIKSQEYKILVFPSKIRTHPHFYTYHLFTVNKIAIQLLEKQ